MNDWIQSASTTTSTAQEDVELLLREFLETTIEPAFLRNKHTRFVGKNLSVLPQHIQGLHCSQPWLVYWTLHASDLLGVTSQLLHKVPAYSIAEFLLMCFTHEATELNSVSDSDDSCSSATLSRSGGFSGGPDQLPHLATTYAAVCSLCILGSKEILSRIDRVALDNWLLSLRSPEGGYIMHRGGECDVRASYCVAVVASLLQLPSTERLLGTDSAQFIARCQTAEGGLSCSPYSTEAHGGYTQCGLAALLLMRGFDLIDLTSMKHWLANRQFEYEGGFNGRVNKLVDSCYSHWIGSSHVLVRVGEASKKFNIPLNEDKHRAPLTANDLYALDLAQLVDVTEFKEPASDDGVSKFIEDAALHRLQESVTESIMHQTSGDDEASCDSFHDDVYLDEEVGDYNFNQRKLQNYVLRCCQNTTDGGLMDKPEHPNDFYHTCYAMSGLSSAQNLQYLLHFRAVQSAASDSEDADELRSYVKASIDYRWIPVDVPDCGAVLPMDPAKIATMGSDKLALLRATNPIVNITKERVIGALRHFGGRSFF